MFEEPKLAPDIATESAADALQSQIDRLNAKITELRTEADKPRAAMNDVDARASSHGLSLRGLVAALGVSAATAAALGSSPTRSSSERTPRLAETCSPSTLEPTTMSSASAGKS